MQPNLFDKMHLEKLVLYNQNIRNLLFFVNHF
jgi:hypothetical protein